MFDRLGLKPVEAGLKPQAVEHRQLDELFSTRKLMTTYLFESTFEAFFIFYSSDAPLTK